MGLYGTSKELKSYGKKVLLTCLSRFFEKPLKELHIGTSKPFEWLIWKDINTVHDKYEYGFWVYNRIVIL